MYLINEYTISQEWVKYCVHSKVKVKKISLCKGTLCCRGQMDMFVCRCECVIDLCVFATVKDRETECTVSPDQDAGHIPPHGFAANLVTQHLELRPLDDNLMYPPFTCHCILHSSEHISTFLSHPLSFTLPHYLQLSVIVYLLSIFHHSKHCS